MSLPRLRFLHLEYTSVEGIELLIASLSNMLEASFSWFGMANSRWLGALAACKKLATLRLFLKLFAKDIASLRMPTLRPLTFEVPAETFTADMALNA